MKKVAEKKEPTEREQLIAGYEKRIKHKKDQLTKTRAFHKEVEAGLQKKIKLDEIQLSALKKAKN
jgi:hypothetical protein